MSFGTYSPMDLSWESTRKFAEKAVYTWWLWLCGYVIVLFFVLIVAAAFAVLFTALGVE